MKRFKEFISEQHMVESMVRRGAVASFAAIGKRHGDQAVSSLSRARFELHRMSKEKTTDAKVERVGTALTLMIDGLIASREQIGAVSAQVTAHALLGSAKR